MSGSVWSAVRNAYASGVLNGGYAFAPQFRYVGTGAPSGVMTYGTISDALAALEDGDVLILGPQGFEEGNLVLSANNITIIGMGNRGACYIEPSGANDEGLQVTGDDCTLYNVGISKGASGSYALNVNAASRFRAFQCKFEGDGVAVLLDGTATGQVGDCLFRDCEFAWCGSCIVGDDSAYGYPTQVRIQDCLFHNYTTVGIGVAASGLFKDLWVENCIFARQEDGSAPTDFILLSDNGNTGTITKNSFASATNATGTITIGTGLLYPTNYTEAGPSTARPA